MRQIVVNRNNLTNEGTGNNKFVYRFPNSVVFKDSYIALSQASMYYSWFNISSTLQNNTFSITLSAGVFTTITLPDGQYEISDINAYIQQTMVENNFYMIDADGNYIYWLEMEVNATRYAVQFNCFEVPAVLPTGYTSPHAFSGIAFYPQFKIPASFNLIVGYVEDFTTPETTNDFIQTYGTGTAYAKSLDNTFSFISTVSPDVQPNANCLVSISNIDNIYASPNSIIYAITPQTGLGGLIQDKPSNYAWNKLLNGTYNQIRIELVGNNNDPLVMNDSNITLLFVIKEYGELI